MRVSECNSCEPYGVGICKDVQKSVLFLLPPFGMLGRKTENGNSFHKERKNEMIKQNE